MSDNQVTEFRGSSPTPDRLTISYDAAEGSYTVTDAVAGRTATFDVVASNGDTTSTPTDAAAYFALLNNSPQNGIISLTYLTYGLWAQSQIDDDPALSRLDAQVFIAGVETPLPDIPRSGSATYTGVADGYAAIEGVPYRLAGSTGSLTADFATGTLASTLFLVLNTKLDGSQTGTSIGLPQFDFSGTISTTVNQFTGSTSSGSYSGLLSGAFYGPTANEAGYAFEITPTGSTSQGIRGVFVGKR